MFNSYTLPKNYRLDYTQNDALEKVRFLFFDNMAIFGYQIRQISEGGYLVSWVFIYLSEERIL